MIQVGDKVKLAGLTSIGIDAVVLKIDKDQKTATVELRYNKNTWREVMKISDLERKDGIST